MEDCATHHGSVIEEVSGTGIEALISAEKLRGTDLCLGQIAARKSGHTPVLVDNSLYRLMFQTVRDLPVAVCISTFQSCIYPKLHIPPFFSKCCIYTYHVYMRIFIYIYTLVKRTRLLNLSTPSRPRFEKDVLTLILQQDTVKN